MLFSHGEGVIHRSVTLNVPLFETPSPCRNASYYSHYNSMTIALHINLNNSVTNLGFLPLPKRRYVLTGDSSRISLILSHDGDVFNRFGCNLSSLRLERRPSFWAMSWSPFSHTNMPSCNNFLHLSSTIDILFFVTATNFPPMDLLLQFSQLHDFVHMLSQQKFNPLGHLQGFNPHVPIFNHPQFYPLFFYNKKLHSIFSL